MIRVLNQVLHNRQLTMKVIAADLAGGTSFMEDYTYHLHPDCHLVLGSHMLEVC